MRVHKVNFIPTKVYCTSRTISSLSKHHRFPQENVIGISTYNARTEYASNRRNSKICKIFIDGDFKYTSSDL